MSKAKSLTLKNLSSLLIFSTVSLIAPTLFAQSQHTETWNFGKRCRVTFEDGNLIAEDENEINIKEGSASFADPSTGDLIAYSDGENLWNAKGDLVADDLLGGPSVMHGVVIVPRPQNPNKLFVISHLRDNSTSIASREFDVANQEAITAVGENASIELDAGAETGREGMLVVPHKNGVDFWVIVSGHNAVFVISVTSAGLGTPQKIVTNIPYARFGLFAISNSGTTLVISHEDVEIDDTNVFQEVPIYSLAFDPETGEIESEGGVAISKELASNNQVRKYGGAFSPDDTKLYYSTLGTDAGTEPSTLYQYDFTDGVETIIDRQVTGFIHSQAKLAQNGKIYVSTGVSEDSVLSVVNAPNEKAADVDFEFSTVQLDSGCNPDLGLPQTITPLADVALGIDIDAPNGVVADSVSTPSGNANLPDGSTLTITVTGDDGSEQTCEAEVQGGAWACPSGAISDLKTGVKYTVVASDGTNSGSAEFVREECVAGEACDVDECATMADNCDENATCTDTLNGFTCECNAPFTGDGVSCSEPDSDMGTVDTDMGADMGTVTPTPTNGGLVLAGGCSSTPAPSASWLFLALAFLGFRKRKKN